MKTRDLIKPGEKQNFRGNVQISNYYIRTRAPFQKNFNEIKDSRDNGHFQNI